MEMGFSGLSPAAFVALWKSRGANEEMFKKDFYYAYNLQGFYAYSEENNNEKVKQILREKVKFLVEDAPALASSLNPDAEIKIVDLVNMSKNYKSGQAEKLTPLVNCGLNLVRTPVVRIDFGKQDGSVIISQLITEGRLTQGEGDRDLYSKRYDPVAAQFLLNMLNEVIKTKR
jgi:hypothetical protein